MRRIILLLSSMAAALLLAGGVALADHLITLDCSRGSFDCVPTNESEHLIGDDELNTLYSRGGDDQIDTLGGGDYANGGHGNDTLYGGDGHDDLNGKVGNDKIYGGADPDWLGGQEDDDFIHGGTEKDTIGGDDGADDIRGGAGADTIHTGGSNGDYGTVRYVDGDIDIVDCGSASDTVYFEKGVDKINRNCEKKFPY
jgi:Ca2+-binding RTX toxin-like protein